VARLTSSIVIVLFLSPVLLPGAARDRVRDGEEPAAFEKNIKVLVAAIQKAKTVTVYEGLPHQLDERDLLAKELKDKKTVKRHGFPFYAEAITPKEGVAKELIALCGDQKSFLRYRRLKKCGGFHPDWLVEFDDGAQKVSVLVCFGCGEARLYGPKNDAFSDLGAGAKKLTETLAALQKNRPKKAGGE
jgi:hypothetical protein